MSFSQVIRQGCSTWNIPLPEEAVEQLEQYSQLLLEKNQSKWRCATCWTACTR